MRKTIFNVLVGSCCGFLSAFLGEFTVGIKSLLIFISLDILTGFLCALVFRKSPKTETGGISSRVAFKGFCQKVFIIALVGVAHRIDLLLGVNYLRDASVFAFLSSELISIVENAGAIGVPIPKMLKDSIDILNRKSESTDSNLISFKKISKK